MAGLMVWLAEVEYFTRLGAADASSVPVERMLPLPLPYIPKTEVGRFNHVEEEFPPVIFP